MGIDVPAEVAGKLYQNDRLANIEPVKAWLESGGIMLFDRYKALSSLSKQPPPLLRTRFHSEPKQCLLKFSSS